MRHGSLFSGIGGFDLAAEWMGWENVFHCEINEFCNKILNHYWPDAKGYTDITKTDFTEWKGKVDIISGGFPCQPYSQAGKRKGKADDRHLWPEMLRAIREVQPMWIVGENVPGLLNWERGMVLAEIKADLESAGFEVFPPCILPACGLNAPHKRDRLWIIAYSAKFGRWQNTERRLDISRQLLQNGSGKEGAKFPVSTGQKCNASNGNGKGFQERIQSEKRQDSNQAGTIKEGSESARVFTKENWEQFPTQSPVFIRDDGFSKRLDGITLSKWRKESITAAAKLYRIRKAMRILYADQYPKKIKWYCDMLQRIMVKERVSEMEAMMIAIEKLDKEVADPDPAKMMFMAATVELIEPSK